MPLAWCGHRAYDQGMETKTAGPVCGGVPTTFAGYPGDETGPQRNLIKYWIRRAGINWHAKGGFTRCVAKLGPKLAKNAPQVNVKGMCANLHKAATGKWPAEHHGR